MVINSSPSGLLEFLGEDIKFILGQLDSYLFEYFLDILDCNLVDIL